MDGSLKNETLYCHTLRGRKEQFLESSFDPGGASFDIFQLYQHKKEPEFV